VIASSLLIAAINWHSVFFYLVSAIACAFGAAVLFSSNVVRMAFYLVISLAATAGLFFLAGAEFLGAMQIMIYVGGTLVLLIFGVMLTAQDAFVSMKTRGGEWIVGLPVGAAFFALLVATAFNVSGWKTVHPELARYTASVQRAEAVGRDASATTEEKQAAWDAVHQPKFRPHQRTTTQLGFAFTGARVDGDEAATPILRHGQSGYLLAFQAVGIHLLIVLVGAAYLSRTRKMVPGRAQAAVAVQAGFEPRPGQRGALLTGLLALGMVVNLLLAGATLVGQESFLQDFPELLLSPPAWLFPVISLLFLLSALCLAVVWGWQRWGLIALWVVPLVQVGLLASQGFAPLAAVGLLVALLLPVTLVTAVVCLGQPSAWSRMD
jgi:NADH-quinone oxidoreductase subunit J